MKTILHMVIAAWFTAITAFAGDTNWMAGIAGTTRLSQLSIPGTHDSGALYDYSIFTGTAKCQSNSIAQQLNFGVRFLDIRCYHSNDLFYIYHGIVDENQTFSQVLAQVFDFLNTNSTECVIMSVKEENTPTANTRSFEATFDSYVATNASKWSLGSTVPALQDVRGRVALLRRFSAASLPKGIDATSWPDNAAPGFTANNLTVEDWYQVTTNAAKWSYITSALSSAFGDNNANHLHLTFTSGYLPGSYGIPNIPIVANYINPLLLSNFVNAPVGHYGCVLMDFADVFHSELIYGVNFRLSGPFVSFSARPWTGGVPLTVTFTNRTIGATNYSWTFGDGGTSSSTNPAHAYPSAGTYSVTLTATGSGITNSLTQTNYIVVMNIPPSITASPQSNTVAQGADATFSVTAAGTKPLSFQWRLAEQPIAGATTNTLTISSSQCANAGAYDVVVTNVGGSITSSVALLTVVAPPVILTQPADETVARGQTASLSVLATNDCGGGLTYLWRLNAASLPDATDSTFLRTNAQPEDSGSYDVVITSFAGAITSSVATLTVTNLSLLVLSPPSLDFGTAFVGSSACASFVVSNASFMPLSGSASILDGPFTIAGGNGAGLSVSALSSTNLAIQFLPLASGIFSNVIIFDTDGGSATNTLYGVGADLPVLSLAQAGTNVVFWFPTITGKTYTVEYEDFLAPPAWFPLLTLPGDGNTNAFTNTILLPTQRFYRLSVQ